MWHRLCEQTFIVFYFICMLLFSPEYLPWDSILCCDRDCIGRFTLPLHTVCTVSRLGPVYVLAVYFSQY